MRAIEERILMQIARVEVCLCVCLQCHDGVVFSSDRRQTMLQRRMYITNPISHAFITFRNTSTDLQTVVSGCIVSILYKM